MFTKLITQLLCFSLIILTTPCYSGQTDESAYDYLKTLEIEQLIKVEVTLDEVFDVFDGLVKAKKVTVATGTTQPTELAPAVTTVLTAQDIEAIGATTIDEVLETVPGLHVARNQLVFSPIYTIRGIYSRFNSEVLMLINGLPLKTLQFGTRGTIFAGMTATDVARIEIIRGPSSAIYGADALAGVINIITKTKEDLQGTETEVRLGSFNTNELTLLHGSQWHGFDIAAVLHHSETQGPDRIIETDLQSHYDNRLQTHVSVAPGPINLQKRNWHASLDVGRENWRLRTSYDGWRGLGTGVGAAQALDPWGHGITDSFNSDLTYHNTQFTPVWEVTAQLSFFRTQYHYEPYLTIYPPGAFGGNYPNGLILSPGVAENNTRLDIYGFYTKFPQHRIRLGTGYDYGNLYKVTHLTNSGLNPFTQQPIPPKSPVIDVSGTSAALLPTRLRQWWYLSLQDEWELTPNWQMTSGIRYDDYSDFGQTINPRLALVWQTSSKLSAKLLYGRAFRAPSFAELYNANNPIQLGNPDVKPETIETWELAFDYRPQPNGYLTANFFYYDLQKKILFYPDPGGKTNRAQNVGEQIGQGVELELRWKLTANASLLTNYAFTKADNQQTHHDAGNYPRHSAYLRADWQLLPYYYLDVSTHWIADRHRVFGDPRPPVADYTTVDLTLRYKDIRRGGNNLALGIRNLFNVDAREPSPGPDSNKIIAIPNDFPLAKRSLFLEWRYRF